MKHSYHKRRGANIGSDLNLFDPRSVFDADERAIYRMNYSPGRLIKSNVFKGERFFALIAVSSLFFIPTSKMISLVTYTSADSNAILF